MILDGTLTVEELPVEETFEATKTLEIVLVACQVLRYQVPLLRGVVGHLDGTPNSGACGSPGNQTLAELKQEASKSKNKGRKRPPPKSKAKNPRRVVTRSSKILREKLLDGMAWARTFVSGPMDPRWNPYKFNCQICKGNVSIYGRGVKEILRHHSTERHLRKDQRWRYEHLAVEDPQTIRSETEKASSYRLMIYKRNTNISKTLCW